MDVLELLAQQQSDNRVQFANQQAARARVEAARSTQRTGEALGFNADQGVMLINVDGNAVPAASNTSGLFKPGQNVIVSDSGGQVGWVDGIGSS